MEWNLSRIGFAMEQAMMLFSFNVIPVSLLVQPVKMTLQMKMQPDDKKSKPAD